MFDPSKLAQWCADQPMHVIEGMTLWESGIVNDIAFEVNCLGAGVVGTGLSVKQVNRLREIEEKYK